MFQCDVLLLVLTRPSTRYKHQLFLFYQILFHGSFPPQKSRRNSYRIIDQWLQRGLSINAILPSNNSPKLWGDFVAIPTAIPSLPFNKACWNSEKNCRFFHRYHQVGTKLTVSCPNLLILLQQFLVIPSFVYSIAAVIITINWSKSFLDHLQKCSERNFWAILISASSDWTTTMWVVLSYNVSTILCRFL